MKIFKHLKAYKKLRKKIREYKKDEKAMLYDLNEFGKRFETLNNIILKQNAELSHLYSNSRDMFLGPKEFIISRNIKEFKKIKISIGGEDITEKVSKIIVSGPDFIEM